MRTQQAYGLGGILKIEVELANLNRKFEKNRQRSEAQEKQLLFSLMEKGFEEPLYGVQTKEGELILLDGFKRLRCALKLGIGVAPFFSLDENEAVAILRILKTSNAKTLTMLEQAAFVEELKTQHGISVAEIAKQLQRSKAWVLVRLKTHTEMSESTFEAILSGRFPFYSYFYTLHPFMRVTGVASKKDLDEFVSHTAGKGLSTRDIELLANAHFRGGDSMREQIKNGDIGWCLQELKERRRAESASQSGLTDIEKKVLRDLDMLQNCMGRLNLKFMTAKEMKNSSFHAQAEILVGGILSRIEKFVKTLRAIL